MMDNVMICPSCQAVMLEKRLPDAREPKSRDKDMIYYECHCGAEFWPAKEKRYSAIWAYRDEMRYKKSISKLGGGSRNGKKRKKPVKKRNLFEGV
jgi:hypothetical protein